MRRQALLLLMILVGVQVAAQEEKEEREGGFKKENLFTGGSLSLGFSNRSFLVGGNPVFGYKLTRWADAGLVGNYTYTSYRDYYNLNDRLRQSVYGGGVFVRLFPVRFLFVQGQIEHNWIRLKYIPPPGFSGADTYGVNGTSLLVGAGYTMGRDPDSNSGFGYFSVMFDVLENVNSPYTDNLGRAIPIVRAGYNIPLFQGRR